MPSFRPLGVLSFTQRCFQIWWNSASLWENFVACFAKKESLYRRISTKYKSSKLFWRILEDNKQNKRENRGKKTVWILRADSRFAWMCRTCCSNAMNSFPLGLRFAFCHQFLAYFDELYQWIHVCLFLTRYFTDKLRNKASFESKYLDTRDATGLSFAMLISFDLICIIR